MTLEQDLYALPPERFIAARDEAVAEARAAGDRALAARIGALRRPTVAAWLVNLVALHRPEQVGALLDLGTALREAQQELRGERLRELSAQRRAAITELVAAARRLAVEAGRRPRDALPLAEVEATLVAALADEDVAAAVRAGRLTRATGYAGFGEPMRPDLRVIDGGAQPARSGGGDRQRGTAGERSRPPGGRQPSGAGPSGEAGRPGKTEHPDETGRLDEAERRGAAERRDRERDVARSDGEREAGRSDREPEAVRRDREREEARAARTARIEAAEAALRGATAEEQDAARALAELSAELDRLRQRQVAAQTALREARLRRRAAERDAHRAGR
ncbi:MAG TPA: hypothetical protein VGJ07_10170 [Rugosimonospora sp.]